MRCRWLGYSTMFPSVVLLMTACAPATSPPPASTGERVETQIASEETLVSKQHEQAMSAPEIVFDTFGEIVVDGEIYKKDIVIENGKVRKQDKDPSKEERAKYNHTPLTPKESIPWECKTLVIGTGMYGRLPIVPTFKDEAERRNVKLIILKTEEAAKYFREHFGPDINAIFHITC